MAEAVAREKHNNINFESQSGVNAQRKRVKVSQVPRNTFVAYVTETMVALDKLNVSVHDGIGKLHISRESLLQSQSQQLLLRFRRRFTHQAVPLLTRCHALREIRQPTRQGTAALPPTRARTAVA